MGLEIERRFLISPVNVFDIFSLMDEKGKFVRIDIKQGYLPRQMNGLVCRVRSSRSKSLGYTKGSITMKYPSNTEGAVSEVDPSIPVSSAEELLELIPNQVRKTRIEVDAGAPDTSWEIDFFHEKLHGLIIAEVELQHIRDSIDIPTFFGPEITGIKELSNEQLCLYPNIGLDLAAKLLKEHDELKSNTQTSSGTTEEAKG